MKYTLNIKSSGFRYSLFIVSFLLLSFSSFSQITLNKPSETHSPEFEKENIIEGTKKIITYHGNSDFSTIEKKQKSIKNVVKFNDLGNVLFYVEINYFGDTMMILNNEYINNKLVKQVINRKNEVEKFINYQYDANGNLLLTSVNNEVIITSKYDKLGFLEEEIFIAINKSDSSIFKTLSYSYFNYSTSKNKFVVVNYKDDYSTFIDTLEYNSFDKIIKSVNTTKGEMKQLTKYSYSDNQSILEINYYKNGELKSFTEYDSLSNKVYEFKFQNGEKKEVEKIEYLYDEKGNWLVKKFYLNLDPNKSEIFQPNYYETRAITYH